MRYPRLLLIAAAAALLAPAAGVAQEQDPAVAGVAQLRAMVAETRGRMLRRGEPVPGWNVGGANPDAEVRRLGGERHYMLSHGEDGDSVGILTGRPIASLAPAGWRVVDSYGSAATPLEAPQLDFQQISPRYVFATRTQWRRRGGIDCTEGIVNALLYEIPDAPESPDDASTAMLFRILILALEGQELCVRAEGDAGSGYTSRTFLPDGTSLPELTPSGRMEIVPARPVDQLINYRPRSPQAPPET